MKKYLSLVLLAVMILTAFSLTSCEEVKEAFDDILREVGVIPPEVRTTITEEEWTNAFKVTNYTLDAKIYGYNLFLSIDDSFIKYYMGYNDLGQKIVYDFKNEYFLDETSIGWLASEGEYIGIDREDCELTQIMPISDITFEKLVYDEETKSYSYSDSDQLLVMCFENGALRKATFTSLSSEQELYINVINIGTTKIDIPSDYSILNDGILEPSKAGKDVITTITEEQLLEHSNLKNYTIDIYFPVSGMFTQVKVHMSETGYEYILSSMYESAHTYYAISDGYMYRLEEYENGKYITVDKEPVESLLGELFDFVGDFSMDMLTYNEDGRYYTLSVDYNVDMHLFFENGQLVQVVLVVSEGDIPPPEGASDIPKVRFTEVVIIISDVGTTVVDLPEFTFDENLE